MFLENMMHYILLVAQFCIVKFEKDDFIEEICVWWVKQDLNLRQLRYERRALTTELLTRLWSAIISALRLDEAFFTNIIV